MPPAAGGSRRKRKSPSPAKIAPPPPPPPADGDDSSSDSALSSPDNELLAELDATVKEEEEEPAPTTTKRRRVTRKNSATAQTLPPPAPSAGSGRARGGRAAAASRTTQSPVEASFSAAASASSAGAGSAATARASSATRAGSRSSPRSPVSARHHRNTPSDGGHAHAAAPEAGSLLGLTGPGIDSPTLSGSAATPKPPSTRAAERRLSSGSATSVGEGHGKKPATSSKSLLPTDAEVLSAAKTAASSESSKPDTAQPVAAKEADAEQSDAVGVTRPSASGSAAVGGKAVITEEPAPLAAIAETAAPGAGEEDPKTQPLGLSDAAAAVEAAAAEPEKATPSVTDPPSEGLLASRRPTLDAVAEALEAEDEGKSDDGTQKTDIDDSELPSGPLLNSALKAAKQSETEADDGAGEAAEVQIPPSSGMSIGTTAAQESAPTAVEPSQGETLIEDTAPREVKEKAQSEQTTAAPTAPPETESPAAASPTATLPASASGDTASSMAPPNALKEEGEVADVEMVDAKPKEEEQKIVAHATAGVSADKEREEGTAPKRERPAVLEERAGLIQFRVVSNDGTPESLIILTGLKNIFQRQLPKMPREYITRLVLDRNHMSMAIVKRGLQVVGGITYRPFYGRKFAEIVFCAITSSEQVKGYGSHLMNHLKDHVKFTSPIMHFLTYADNYAIGYFKKQGFTKEISLDRSVWVGYIKDYEGGTLMQCSMVPRVEYLKVQELLAHQKELVLSKIRQISKSHVVHRGLDIFREREKERERKKALVVAEKLSKEAASSSASAIDPVRRAALEREVEQKIIEDEPSIKLDAAQVPGLAESGWTPEMDELSRKPKRGPHHNLMRHVLIEMGNHASSWPFLNPVNGEEVPDYYDVIKNPMDLSTMENKLENNQYAAIEDLVVDAQLIFDNCRRYNPPQSPYAKCANKLEKFLKDHLPLWRQSAGI